VVPTAARNCVCIAMICLAALPAELEGQTPGSLRLAHNAKTVYAIVIGKQACDAEEYAADELARFLKEMTDATFPVKRDDAPRSNHEIVLGRTNRSSLRAISPDLRPEVSEGFVIHCEGASLTIQGRIPRATLYGVYDFLEVELGVRFLAAKVNHVPHRTTLDCDVHSRKYDPPLEYRNIYDDAQWAVRNRVNATWGWVPMRTKLGGCEYIGRSCHSLPALLPHDQHFDSHPEYFALRDGERRRKAAHRHSHPCLMSREVLDLVVASVVQTIQAYQRHKGSFNPYSQIVVPVEYDDHGQVCQCAECLVVNDSEGTVGGTLFRFLNAVGAAIEDEYPEVSVATLAYGNTEAAPKRTTLRKNVIIRFAPIRSDFARRLDDPDCPLNRIVHENLLKWSRICEKLHVWNYYTNFHSFFTPYPNLRVIDHNIRLLHKHGMRGLYAQSTQTQGSELRELRHYVLAKCMWRPETQARQVMEEFCRLYYGEAGPGVMEYVDLLHDYHFTQVDPAYGNPLTCYGSPKYRHSYDDEFVGKADAILARAEAAAKTDDEKQRVAVARLPIWYLMLTKEFGREGQVLALPVEWWFKLDPDDVGLKEGWPEAVTFPGWSRIRTDNFWTKQGYDYHGIAWYATRFDLPASAAESSLSLYFGAVDGTCDVFIDGAKIGEQKKPPAAMWNQGFYLPVRGALKAGRHTLTVRVEKKSHAAGIWQPVSLTDCSQPPSKELKTAGLRFIEVSKAAGVRRLAEEYGEPRAIKNFYSQIEALLRRGPHQPAGQPVPGTIDKSAAMLGNPHKTYAVVADETAQHGSCVKQTADRRWTLGQAIRWHITRHLEGAQQAGSPYLLRARIKVHKTGDHGSAFRFGYSYVNLHNYGGGICADITVKARDVKNGEWQWYELPAPLKLRDGVRGQDAFVWAQNNPQSVSAVYVDSFELVPVKR